MCVSLPGVSWDPALLTLVSLECCSIKQREKDIVAACVLPMCWALEEVLPVMWRVSTDVMWRLWALSEGFALLCSLGVSVLFWVCVVVSGSRLGVCHFAWCLSGAVSQRGCWSYRSGCLIFWVMWKEVSFHILGSSHLLAVGSFCFLEWS